MGPEPPPKTHIGESRCPRNQEKLGPNMQHMDHNGPTEPDDSKEAPQLIKSQKVEKEAPDESEDLDPQLQQKPDLLLAPNNKDYIRGQ